jgi:hypothetical protein
MFSLCNKRSEVSISSVMPFAAPSLFNFPRLQIPNFKVIEAYCFIPPNEFAIILPFHISNHFYSVHLPRLFNSKINILFGNKRCQSSVILKYCWTVHFLKWILLHVMKISWTRKMYDFVFREIMKFVPVCHQWEQFNISHILISRHRG